MAHPTPRAAIPGPEVAIVDRGRVAVLRGRVARIILWLAENQELINPEERGRLTFHFAGDSLKVEVHLLRDV